MKNANKYSRQEVDILLECLDDEGKEYLSEKLLPSLMSMLIYGIAIGLSIGLVLIPIVKMIVK